MRVYNELVEKNMKVVVLTKNMDGKYKHVERIDTFIVHRVNTDFRKFSMKYFNSFFSCIVWFKRNRGKFDVIHLHNCCTQFWISSFMAKLFWRKKIIFEMCLYGGDDPISMLRSRSKIIYQKTMAYIDHYIPSCEPIKNACIEVGIPQKKITKIPRMVDTNRYKPVDERSKRNIRKNLGLNPGSSVIVFIGSMTYRKGLDILIAAFEKTVKFLGKDLVLLLIGRREPKTSNERTMIEFVNKIDRMIANSQYINNRVVFTGLVDNVETYLQSADLFVFPSRWEGFGLAILEALSVGLPSVVSPLDGISKYDIFTGENEGVITDLSVDSFSSSMIRLLEDSAERKILSKNARKRAIESFSQEKIVDKYMKLFQTLC